MAAPRRPRGTTTPRLPRYEPPPQTIPRQGQTVPVPSTTPPPVPRLGGRLLERQPAPTLPEPIRQLPGILRAGLEPFEQQRFTRTPSAFAGLVTQESLPVAGLLESGQTPSEFYGYETTQPTALEESQRRAAEYNDPLNTIEAAAGHFYTGLQFGTRTPFVLFGVQERLGYTDDQMKSLGYMRTLAGWVRLPKGPKTVTGGTVSPGSSRQTVYVGGGGGGSRYASTPGSSLINWRI